MKTYYANLIKYIKENYPKTWKILPRILLSILLAAGTILLIAYLAIEAPMITLYVIVGTFYVIVFALIVYIFMLLIPKDFMRSEDDLE